MKTVFILTCLSALAVSVPVGTKVRPASAEFPGFIQVEASNPVEAVRKARQLFDIDIDIYNNNGAGYFDNGDDFYGGGGYGGYGGGYGGYGGYGGGCYGCFGGFF
ncbi:hypothetical protein HA402_015866 [Bradysia odoriphaga]|nr:hypothetical protein HA402_015866 [Bradysia odoriphaga]